MSTPNAISAMPMRQRWWALAILLSGNFVVILDLFIVHVAIPDIRLRLEPTEVQLQLVLVGYAAAYGIGLMTGARLGDMLGRRRMFLWGMAIFTIASLGCGLSPTANGLVLARIAQGLGAALLMPQVLASIRLLFEGAERTRAFAILGAVQGMAATVSQLLGGWLIELSASDLGWRTVFLINVPVGVLAIVAGLRVLPATSRIRARLDLAGTLAALAGVALVLIPVMLGREHGWPWWSWGLPLGSLGLWAWFLAHERRLHRAGGFPMFDVTLLRNRPFLAGAFGFLLFYSAISSFFFSLTWLLQAGLQLSPLAAGLVFTPSAVAFFAGSLLGPRLRTALGEQVLIVGVLVFMAGLALAIAVGATDPHALSWLVIALALNGLGQGLAIPAALGSVLARVDDRQAGVASGLVSTLQTLGNALGVTIVGTALFGQLVHQAGDPATLHGLALAWATLYNLAAAAISLALFRLTVRTAH
ncbi:MULTISPECIES: MFS transporter [Pseudomonadota]|jgi:MFS family permease|uniref:MFS transporter n=1 Tax=Pseudomonadota TaxID=1224 RepID=UPI001B76A649|nr:MFS transporter [Achromobacter xylosoxidans]MBP7654967.1 MFS transporter [Pseudoxanthomonas sp.]MCH4578143.1 MFS transporter [Achromobacter xylosoxidans]